jgi:hypothetical protein
MRVFGAVAMIALLSAPAYAQGHIQQAGEQAAPKSRLQIEADRDAEKAYKKSLSSIPDQAASDPWGNVRSEGAPKAVVKPPAKRTKIGGTAH